MPDFSYQRNTIYLRFAHRDYHKGSTLGELCRVLGIKPVSYTHLTLPTNREV